jgi:hypothetical protein
VPATGILGISRKTNKYGNKEFKYNAQLRALFRFGKFRISKCEKKWGTGTDTVVKLLLHEDLFRLKIKLIIFSRAEGSVADPDLWVRIQHFK